MDENDVFSFIKHLNTKVDSNRFDFNEYVESFSIPAPNITIDIEQVGNKYVHKFYVKANSNIEGEISTFIYINGYGKIRVAGDFYGEHEPIYVNLSNFGVEIPDSVQKTIYDSNVHEDYKDNILLNRKFKELMSNYWDVIANRGSYKSLLNSLNWFEWGDIIKIREMWKRDNAGVSVFDDREINSLLEDKYLDSTGNFMKTTFMSLYAYFSKDTEKYDSEYNPILENISLKWSREDLALKMVLLSEFFGTFFMPIHMSIFHACVEDRAFTNTIKTLHGSSGGRVDAVGDFDYVKCNVDGKKFSITNVNVQVTNDTVYSIKYTPNTNKKYNYFGVDVFPSDGELTRDDESIKTFGSQFYGGPGVVIPFHFVLPNLKNDFIKYTSVVYVPDGKTKKETLVLHDVIHASNDGNIYVDFNLLSKEAKVYEMVFTFILGSSKTLTRKVVFETLDVDNVVISLYKVKSKPEDSGFTYNDFYDTSMYNYIHTIQPKTEDSLDLYTKYIPYMENFTAHPSFNYNGIKLNRTIVIDTHGETERDIRIIINKVNEHQRFLVFSRKNENDEIKYLVFVSKFFNEPISNDIIGVYKVIRNELTFYPQFHYLQRLDGNTLNDFTISQYDTLCCIPEIHISGNTVEKFRYGHLIDSAEWVFNNISTNEEFTHTSSQQPFISNVVHQSLPNGYYDIIFRYKISNSIKEIRLNSGFLKKDIEL
jgi:hypothetical protein